MTSTLRALRNFGILFLGHSTVLLVVCLGIGARFQSLAMPTDSQYYTSQFSLQSVDIILLIISLTFTVLMVILLYVIVFLALK